MARSIKPWVGRTDDSKPPPKVGDRLRRLYPICILCEVAIPEGERSELHHVKSLKDGGPNSEENMRPVHIKCHKIETAKHNKEHARAAKQRQGARGMKAPPKTKIRSAPKVEKVAKEDKPVRESHLSHLSRGGIFRRYK